MHLHENTFLQGEKYKIVRFIKRGGFGCTYEAEHVMLEKRVAIKEFFPKDFCNRDEATANVTVGTLSKEGLVNKLKKKFVDEAKALCHLEHKGIVKVSDVFEENNTAYFVMDYVDGQSLDEIVKKQGPLSEARALKYIRQVCDALQYVHNHNRLHLDIKPGNIMIDGDDNAVLIDFGASKQYDEVEGENTSTLMGKTPGYAPLEQMGNDVIKFMPATDIYALGATLYKVLTGVTPASANLLASGETLDPLPNNISKSTAKAIAEAMRINKKLRPQTVEKFVNLLDGSVDSDDEESTVISPGQTTKQEEPRQKIIYTNPEPEPQEEKPKPNHSKLYTIIAACILLAIAVFFITRTGSSGPQPPVAAKIAETEVTEKSYTNSKGVTFTYTGEVNENGIPNGEGKGTYSNGKYDGEYVNGLRHGRATYDTSNGSNHFEGTYSNDEYSKGRLTFTEDGSYFEGTFSGNEPYNGKYYDKSEGTTYTVQNGEFK